ncbi:pheromone A receptor-domain-containing protein [Phlebopus sp. FC_14]|nr:pheromone A receptor-domain-containing protein [Phlebopus sp. FC_14]
MQAEVPVLSLISAGLSLVPLVFYLRASNIAAVAIGCWLCITNIIYALDALVWALDANIWASVWCDISTSFITGSHIALPAACLCICIHLERLASFCHISTAVAKRRRILIESLICFGLPVVYVALHLVVQPRRYDLYEGFGCRPATYPAIVAIFLVWIPPLVLAFGTIIFAGIAWRHFLVHGVYFSRNGARSSVTSLTCNMYIRLVGMAILEVALSITMMAVAMWYMLSPGLATMSDMSRNLDEVLIWGSDVMTGRIRMVLIVEWAGVVIQSFVFFGLFACRKDVVDQTWEAIDSCRRHFRRRRKVINLGEGRSFNVSTDTSAPVLPVAILDFTVAEKSSSTDGGQGLSTDKVLPPIPPRPPPLDLADMGEMIDNVAMMDPTLLPLDSPSGRSAIASSHNSLESNFDPRQLVLPPGEWPRPPSVIPVRFSRRSSSMGLDPVWAKRPFSGSTRSILVQSQVLVTPLPAALPRRGPQQSYSKIAQTTRVSMYGGGQGDLINGYTKFTPSSTTFI